ncbi:YdcF family protein [Loktanella sp. F6476L]|uniref:YdcF family protein n=1 Tax=Loktanella sp. F6476L TaxID=2926405 RepID=UPI001FF110D4|nr:YdcF family protein [Loktanella sp. F6476L]MCK0121762.1 YdcF family protein [Loktanella sp. F6476L]
MSAIVILGAAVWPDGPSPTLRRRTLHAASLWQQNPAQIIVACGGLGKNAPTEATVMRDLLINAKVPTDVIHCDYQSTSTYENLRNAAQILKPFGIRNITIVTNGYHGPRSKLVARAVGLKPQVSAPDITGAHMPSHYRMVARELPAIPAYAARLLWWRFRDRNL